MADVLNGSSAHAHSTLPISSYLDAERRAHEAFAESRRRVYVDQLGLMDQLNAFVTTADGPRGMIVTGESGSGKSALLANWARHHSNRFPTSFVVEHYVGASTSGNSHLGILRHLIAEISNRYPGSEAIPTTASGLEDNFPMWLARAQGATLVIVVDGLDQLEESSRSVSWMPTYLHAGLRVTCEPR